MAVFKINLIRDRVTSPRSRQRLFWGMIVYLLVCGVAMAGLVHVATRNIVTARQRREDIRGLESHFLQSHPGQRDLTAYAESVRVSLAETVERLQALDRALASRAELDMVLTGLFMMMPAELTLMNVALEPSGNSLRVDVVQPVGANPAIITGADLIDAWQQDPNLAEWLEGIKLILTRRDTISRRPVQVLQFECRLAGKGS